MVVEVDVVVVGFGVVVVVVVVVVVLVVKSHLTPVEMHLSASFTINKVLNKIKCVVKNHT